MALLDRIARQRAYSELRRSDPVSMEEFGYLLGQSTGQSALSKAGVTIGARRVLGIPAWYSGVRYIAESIASLPVHTYRDTAGQRNQRANPPWLTRPDTELPWFGLVEFLLMSLLHRGNAYAFKIRNPLGQVVGLRPLHPDRVKPGQTSGGVKVFQIDQGELGWGRRDVLHIPGLSYDGVVGLNPIQYHADALGTVAAADEYAGTFFRDGTMEKSYLSVPQVLNEDDAKILRLQWETAHKGLVNAHRLAVLGGGAEYKTIGLDPAQTQLLETRKYSVTDISRLLRLPPHKLYDLERATFSNIEHQSIESVTDGVRPWVERLEAWINFDVDLLADGNFVEFQIEGMLRGDQKSRFEAYAAGVSGGFLMPSEPRRKENLPYIEGSDFLNRPLNMAQVGPDAGADTPPPDQLNVLDLTWAAQRIYLAVSNGVLSAEEARELLNRAGAHLTGPPPKLGGAPNDAT